LDISIEKIAKACLEKLGVSISEFRGAVTLGEVNRNKIELGMRTIISM